MFFPEETERPRDRLATVALEQRVVPSRTGGEYAILFNIGEVECAVCFRS